MIVLVKSKDSSILSISLNGISSSKITVPNSSFVRFSKSVSAVISFVISSCNSSSCSEFSIICVSSSVLIIWSNWISCWLEFWTLVVVLSFFVSMYSPFWFSIYAKFISDNFSFNSSINVIVYDVISRFNFPCLFVFIKR